jgi:hypothetical protein
MCRFVDRCDDLTPGRAEGLVVAGAQGSIEDKFRTTARPATARKGNPGAAFAIHWKR